MHYIFLDLYTRDYYLTSAGWISDSNCQVSVVYMGRSQNYSVISLCSKEEDWKCLEVSYIILNFFLQINV